MNTPLPRRHALIALAALATACTRARAQPAPPAWPPEGSRLTLTPAEWRARLTPAWYEVLRDHGTERAFIGQCWDHLAADTDACVGCGALA